MRKRVLPSPVQIKIEHRLFSFITTNWKGRELTDYLTVVELIGATTTKTGLTVRAEWDDEVYPIGTKITDKDLDALPVRPNSWHGEWNYAISARSARSTNK